MPKLVSHDQADISIGTTRSGDCVEGKTANLLTQLAV
jgi:hypothetical protein